MNCYVYHICREQDRGDITKGYIGISSNPGYRWMRHKKYEKQDSHLRRAYAKYDDIIEYILVQGSRDYCLMIEEKARPVKGIGWNIEKGGSAPPIQYGPMSEAQKQKIGKANSGMNSAGWKGWWVIEGIRYLTTKEAANAHGVTP